jgi:transglutaminase-like putative cysteine protease
MRYEAVEPLSSSRVFAEAQKKFRPKRKHSRDSLELRSNLSEGWFLLFLLIAVVYSAIWCVQLAITTPSMGFLTYVTAGGLALGVYGARQTRFPSWLLHGLALVSALLLAYWLASGSEAAVGTSLSLFQRIVIWFNLLVAGGVSNDDAIFVFFVATLGFVLAYTSAWLVYRTRSPWLMVVANAAVLLISLNGANPALVVFLVIFVLSSLLLLLRFNLYEWMVRWQRQGLRYADDLGWDIMQAGALVSIGLIVFSWILPGSYLNPSLASVWNASNGPVSQMTNAWNRLFSVQGASNVPNRGNFRENLALGGNPNLSDEIVFTLKTQDTTVPYLAFVSYDTYDNGQWTIKDAEITDGSIPANTSLPTSAQMTRPIDVSITVKNPPGEQHPYIAGPSGVTSMNVTARLLTDQTGAIIAWLSPNGNLPPETNYTVTSHVSAADVETLKQQPLPKDAPVYTYDSEIPDALPPIHAFNPVVLKAYTQLPKDLDKRIPELARLVTKDAKTMYEKMDVLERYLRGYQYSLDVNPPPGEDPTAWFLFEGRKGFCNYYSSAFVLMARSLGLPARVVAGYRYGTAQEGGGNVIRGKDAHSWPQVYFAGYGWVDFEPTAAFSTFTRPQPDQYNASDPANSGTNPGGANLPLPTKPFQDEGTGGGSTANNLAGDEAQRSLNQVIIALSGTLILLLAFSGLVLGIWWRRLFLRYSLASQVYGRVCLLANLGGVKWHPSQTPYEYLEKLSLSALPASADSSSLERLGDIYVRERWADPESAEHPLRSGEIKDLPGIWQRLSPYLFGYTLRHPQFLRWLPQLIWQQTVRLWKVIRTRRLLDDEF